MRTLRKDRPDGGFSLVELLVVIIIIGILTAIAIPVLLNQRRQAFEAAVKSDLHNVSVAVTAAQSTDGTVDEAQVHQDVRLSPSNTVEVVVVGETYCLRGWHTGSLSTRHWMVVGGALQVDDGAGCTGSALFVLS